jgi:gluconolactonase
MRLFTRVIVVAISVVVSLQAIGQSQAARRMKVVRLAPALDQLIAPGVEPEVVSGGYAFTEGPMWRDGRLWFSDEEGDRVHAVTPNGHDTILVDFARAPYGRPDRQKTGPNAMATSKDGSVVMCQQYNRAVVRLVGEPDHLKPVPFFDSYQGKHLNSPNDLVFLPDGSFFFTDPPYGLKGRDHDPAKQLSFNGVFHYKDGKLTPIVKNLTLPNGVALSPDNKTLYVNNSGPKQRVIAYSLRADGTIGPPHDVIDFTGKEGPGAPDGIKTDSRGNIWTTGPGGIRILTPSGKMLGQIVLPEVAANLAWGGDGSTLYITARTHIYRVQTLVQGHLPAFRQ